jgi:lysyl endopeptidase
MSALPRAPRPAVPARRPTPPRSRGRGRACRIAWLGAVAFLADGLSAAGEPPREVIAVAPLVLASSPTAGRATPPPLRLADGDEPSRSLPAASEGAGDALAAMAAWNAAGNRPQQIGFVRPLPQPLQPAIVGPTAAGSALRPGEGALGRASGGELVWGARVHVAGAHRLRLRLETAALPPQAQLWVWGRDETPRAFGPELRGDDGVLWTPSVGGGELAIEIAWPGQPSAGDELPFRASAVLELFPAPPLLAAATEGPACLVDSACVEAAAFPALAAARRAVAHLEFVRSEVVPRAFLCTGALLNDRDDATIVPYLLTANHCFDSPGAAASLEAFFDYFSPACGAPAPALAEVPRSSGARLLVSSPIADVTLVELQAVPPGRTFLGWTTAPQPQGAVVHRLSHPVAGGEVLPQSYSRAVVDHRAGACNGFGRPEFLYSRLQVGGTLGGSSGSPAMTAAGLVVGQLLGTCGSGTQDPCDPLDSEVDGSLAASFEALAPFLDPQPAAPCSPSPTVLCLDGEPGDRRYRAEVAYATGQAGRLAGDATAVPLPAGGVTRGGVFWFFAPVLPEVLVKLVDGCAVNGHRWAFLGPATNAGLTVTLTDTATGRRRVYASTDPRPAQPVQDLRAFPCEE